MHDSEHNWFLLQTVEHGPQHFAEHSASLVIGPLGGREHKQLQNVFNSSKSNFFWKAAQYHFLF